VVESGVHNNSSGSPQYLIQAGTINGGMHFHVAGTDIGATSANPLQAAVDELGLMARRQLEDEAGVRGLCDPDPLPILWASSGPVGEILDIKSMANSSASGPALSGIDGLVADFLALDCKRLVLLGEPGSGKSTLALMLALHLLKTRRPADAVPILLPVDSWDPRREHLRTWLTRRLGEQYPQIDRRHGPGTVLALVEADRILPVLDGLDEMPGETRARAVDALNRTLTPDDALIITSRVIEYEEVTDQVGNWRAASILRALPVEASAARDYLLSASAARPGRWSQVLAVLSDDPAGPLAQALSTPLMIWLARRSYAAPDSDPAELAERKRFPDRTSVENRLLDGLVPAVFGDAPAPTSVVANRWEPERAEAYLRFLARYFTRRESPDLVWWRITPLTMVCGGFAAGVVITAVSTFIGFILEAVAGHPQSLGSEWVEAEFALLDAMVIGIFAGISDHFTKGWFFTAGDRWARRRGLTARGIILAALCCLIISIPWEGSAVLLGWLLVPMPYRLIRTVVHPARSGTDRARLRAERHVFALTAGYAISLSLIGTVADFNEVTLNSIVQTLPLTFGALFVAVVATPWGRWQLARLSLVIFRKLPLHALGFFDDAHRLGVLRRVGESYQFRHVNVQLRLAKPPGNDRAVGRRRSTSRLQSERRDPAGMNALVLWKRGHPWRWRWWTIVLMGCVGVLANIASIIFARPYLVLIVALEIVLVADRLPRTVARFFRRRRYLGGSLNVYIGHDEIAVTYGKTQLRLAPDDVNRLRVRNIEGKRGRPTKFSAVHVQLRPGISAPPGSCVSRDGWIPLIPLDRTYPLTAEVSGALKVFAGSRWEPPLRNL
jgi:NACHT domain